MGWNLRDPAIANRTETILECLDNISEWHKSHIAGLDRVADISPEHKSVDLYTLVSSRPTISLLMMAHALTSTRPLSIIDRLFSGEIK